eukprot:361812-Chlamydomonas_euryale.AAC.1
MEPSIFNPHSPPLRSPIDAAGSSHREPRTRLTVRLRSRPQSRQRRPWRRALSTRSRLRSAARRAPTAPTRWSLFSNALLVSRRPLAARCCDTCGRRACADRACCASPGFRSSRRAWRACCEPDLV